MKGEFKKYVEEKTVPWEHANDTFYHQLEIMIDHITRQIDFWKEVNVVFVGMVSPGEFCARTISEEIYELESIVTTLLNLKEQVKRSRNFCASINKM